MRSWELLRLDRKKFPDSKEVIEIRENALYTKIYEAHLEAAPQIILQLSILQQTGDYGKYAIYILL